MPTSKDNLITVEAELYRKFRELALVFWKWRKAKRIYRTTKVNIVDGTPCPDCDGTGYRLVVAGNKNHPCKRCDATGRLAKND